MSCGVVGPFVAAARVILCGVEERSSCVAARVMSCGVVGPFVEWGEGGILGNG